MKTKKILIPVLLASVLGTGAAITAETYSVRDMFVEAAYTNTNVSSTMGDDLKLTNVTTTGTVGGTLTLPTVSTGNGTTVVTVSILNPRGIYEAKGNVVTGNTYAEEGDYAANTTGVIDLKYSGTYVIKYEATNQGMVTSSEEITVDVKANNYSIALPTNSQYVIPSVVKTNQSNFKVELPTVKMEDEEQTLYTNTSGTVAKNTSATTSMTIVLTDKDGVSTTLLDSATDTLPNVDNNGKYYVNVDSAKLAKQGAYIITYRYYEGTSADTRMVKATTTERFTASSTLNTDDIKLQIAYNKSKPTASSIVLGKENTLPGVTVKNKTKSETIDAYTTITVEYREHNSTADYTVLGTISETTTDLFQKPGDYRLTYTARLDLFGVEAVTDRFNIDNVVDNTKPELYIVDAYELTDENIEATENQEYKIPSYAVLSAENKVSIALPAMYAIDNVTKDQSKLTYKIEYRKESNNTRTTIYNSSFNNADDVPAYNETRVFDGITQAGEYRIIYSVTDEKGNTTEMPFSLTVYAAGDAEYEDKVKVSKPEISFAFSTQYVDATEDLVFDAPSVKDIDTRLQIKTTYTGDSGVAKDVTVGDNGQYIIEKEVLAANQSIVITVTATNDLGTTSTVSRKVIVNRGTADTSADLTFTADANTYLADLYALNGATDAVDQGTNVMLPAFVAQDAMANAFSLSVVVRDKYNNIVPVFNGLTSNSNDATTSTITYLEGAYFKATYYGEYTITYIASNSSTRLSKSYQIAVNNTQLPELVLSNLASLSKTIQVGKAYYPETARLSDNGQDIPLAGEQTAAVATTYWKIYRAEKPEYLTSIDKYLTMVKDITTVTAELREQYAEEYNTQVTTWEQANKVLTSEPIYVNGVLAGFIPKEVGVYYIQYFGDKDGDGTAEVSRIVTIKAEENTKPVITVDKGYQEYYSAFVADEGETTMTISIPGFSVEDEYEEDRTKLDASKKVTVTNSNGDNFEVTKQADGSYTFLATKDDTYTAVYSATDSSGNPAETQQFVVYVGDYEDPQLVFDTTDKQEKVIPSEVKLGQTITIDAEDLIPYLRDNVTDAEKIKVTMVLRNSSNKSMTNEYTGTNSSTDRNVYNKYTFTFSETGKYTLTVTFKDEAGNTATPKTFTINCTEDTEGNKNVVGTVVGTVLIVLALALLAGVIIYFAVTGKKGKKTGKKSKKSTK